MWIAWNEIFKGINYRNKTPTLSQYNCLHYFDTLLSETVSKTIFFGSAQARRLRKLKFAKEKLVVTKLTIIHDWFPIEIFKFRISLLWKCFVLSVNFFLATQVTRSYAKSSKHSMESFLKVFRWALRLESNSDPHNMVVKLRTNKLSASQKMY